MDALRDRAVGALFGLAVGDAVGTTLEFRLRDSYEPLTDMVGGGPFELKVGQWTDDTSMALALADSLIDQPEFEEAQLMRRFCNWHEFGDYSCTGGCFDIGMATRTALNLFRKTGNPIAGDTNPNTAGNGSLMRLAPVASRFWGNRPKLYEIAARQSKTTHGASEAVEACVAYADFLATAITSGDRTMALSSAVDVSEARVLEIVGGGWRKKRREDISSSGYVVHSMEAAIWSVGNTDSFREAVLLAANLGDDADTVAAIAGQLAGALYGLSGIPIEWRRRLAWAEEIEKKGHALFDRGLLEYAT